jgi:signal transduction histidine kinase
MGDEARRFMRFTVKTKIIAGLLTIVSVGVISLLVIYYSLTTLKQAMDELGDLREPISAAAYEMEVNVNGITLAVVKYLDAREPLFREWVSRDEHDFERFLAAYHQLSITPREQDFGVEIDLLYQKFRTLGRTLMQKQDEQSALFDVVVQNIEQVDIILDTKLQPGSNPRTPDGFAKTVAVIDMEAAVAEVALWLTNYRRTPKAEYKELLFKHDLEFRATFERFVHLPLTTEEQRQAWELNRLYTLARFALKDVIVLEDTLRAQTQQFLDQRVAIDKLLDTEIQTLAVQNLQVPRAHAEQTERAALRTVQIVIPLFTLIAIGIAAALIRAVTRPVDALVQGTKTVGQGDLTYRLTPRGGDEFAVLARNFNHMVGQLETTTVSKARLEASEAQLQETVTELRNEIDERVRLQESLRRSEVMAAMGMLVGGVAHEVRNPLFAISSTLDAFEARFTDKDEYHRYLTVLRGEIDRLTNLMWALLEYGKPPSHDLALGSLGEVIAHAVRACAPLALSANVEVIATGCEREMLAPMNRQRLQQVFQNLIDNAIRYSPRSGVVSIEVTLEAAEACVSCRVCDSGPGFQPDDLSRLFTPFFSRRRGGTGLGLAIVQRIVEEHSGSVTATNRPEGGAVMIVRLPCVQQVLISERAGDAQGAA